MPKLVNYAARFEFLREAAFVVVRDQGVAALSRHTVAAAMGTSINTVRRLLHADASLAALAADEVVNRRRRGRFGRMRDAEPATAAAHLLHKLLPDTDQRVAEEFVWLRLLLDHHRVPVASGESPTALRERFRIADRGHTEEWDTGPQDGHEAEAATDDPAGPLPPAAPDPWVRHRDDREDEVTTLVDGALALLCVPAERLDDERLHCRSLVEGLTLLVCTGRVTPEVACGAVTRHLTLLHRGLG